MAHTAGGKRGSTRPVGALAEVGAWPAQPHRMSQILHEPHAEKEPPLPLRKRGKHLNSKKITMDQFAYIPVCNKYLQVSLRERNLRQTTCKHTTGHQNFRS